MFFSFVFVAVVPIVYCHYVVVSERQLLLFWVVAAFSPFEFSFFSFFVCVCVGLVLFTDVNRDDTREQ